MYIRYTFTGSIPNKDSWVFSVETLYEKSGSESSFRLFKSKLKKVVLENDIPEFSMEFVEKSKQGSVVFTKSVTQQLDNFVEEFEKTGKTLKLKRKQKQA